MTHENYMRAALQESQKAYDTNNRPFGAIVVDALGGIVWKDHDRVKEYFDPTAHGEINAIRGLCKLLESTSLEGYIFYTTSEPCVTCLSACIKAKVSKIYYGAKTESSASLPLSTTELSKSAKHPILVEGGILENECLEQRQKLA